MMNLSWMKIFRNLCIISLITLTSCLFNDGFKDSFTPFNVDEGDHKFKQDGVGLVITRPSLKHKGSIKFKSRFEDNTFYDRSVLSSDSMDINKLYGITDCNSSVHKHSARFGWRPLNKDLMEIFAYVYSNGRRVIVYMGTVSPYESVLYEIDSHGSNYDFWFKGNHVKIPRDKNCKTGIYTRLFPYFGGNNGAPNNMTIWLHEID